MQLLALLSLATLANADQLVLVSSKDNTLYEDAGGAVSNAKGENCFAGRTGAAGGGLIRRALIAFDLSAIPAGATITAVSLQLNCSQANTGNATIQLQRLLADWGEGTSLAPPGAGSGMGVPSTPNDATWIHTFFPSSFWASPGGDFSPSVSGSQIVSVAGIYTLPSQAGMVADVQFWLDNPGQNFGWCLVGDESTVMTTKRFDTRESMTPGLRPLLTVDFTPPPGQVYCTAKVNSCGTLPAIGFSGVPSATAVSGFVVDTANSKGTKCGLLLYGDAGPAQPPFPFSGGLLCIAPTIHRSIAVCDAAGTPGACNGELALDMNAFATGALGGNPLPSLLVPGTQINCQFWGRDTLSESLLSDALEYVIGL